MAEEVARCGDTKLIPQVVKYSWHKRRYTGRKAQGVCVVCGNPMVSPGRIQCIKCSSRRNSAHRRYLAKIRHRGLCILCKTRTPDMGYKCCASCIESRNRFSKQKHAEFRRVVLDRYGHTCDCCGIAGDKFLTIDHVDNDGASHRKKSGDVYRWLCKNDFPPNFRTLCWNCNAARYLNGGICPHKCENNNELTCRQ